jgi:CRP-like cAMP-binding protein
MITGKILARNTFFASLDHHFLDEVAALGSYQEIEAGKWLFKQETFAHNLYLITEGKITLVITFRDKMIGELNPHTKGEIIGWSALVKPNIYTMGARAEEPSKLIGFNGKALMELLENNCDQGFILLRNLTEVIGERLSNRNVQLTSLKV